jgi:hypothetical protein
MGLGHILPNRVLTCHLSSLTSYIGFHSIEYGRVSLRLAFSSPCNDWSYVRLFNLIDTKIAGGCFWPLVGQKQLAAVIYCRLGLGDGVVDRGSYARKRRSSSTSSSYRSRQSQDAQNDEMLWRHEEMMQNLMQSQQYIILIMQVTIFKYVIFPIL